MTSNTFLHQPDVMSSILERILTFGITNAKSRGADHGAIVAAFYIDGELFLRSRACNGDIAKESNPNLTWEDDHHIGINYVGFAIGKIMQSIRTGTFSEEGSALGYGESDAKGSYREICFDRNKVGEDIPFELHAAFSGLDSDTDFDIAHEAIRSGWAEMQILKKRYDGHKGYVCRLTAGCR